MRFRPLIATLVLLPSIAVAQRGSGSAAGKKTDLFDKDATPAGPTLRLRDIEDQSPLKLLIDRRKDLKLSDSQLAQLKDAEPRLRDKNAPLYKSVDSLLRALRPTSDNPSEAERSQMRSARYALTATIAAVRANYDAAATDAIAPLDAEQQAKAKEMITRQREEGEKEVRDKLAAGNNSGG
jgi:hypothetical protein